MDPWEALAVDDEVLKKFLERSNSATTFIPGPAANAQAVILNRQLDEAHNTQEFMNKMAAASHARDFYSNAWKWAEQFIKHHALVQDRDIKNITPLSQRKSLERMPFMACVVKECKPNGLGDMLITMKDPSDIAKASIHNKVLKDAEFGSDVAVGSVLLLKEVAVFKHPRLIQYLNITLRNIVKVFKYNISPPTEEEVKASLPVVRLNYVPKKTVDQNKETNVQSDLNVNQNINMDHNIGANVDTNNPPPVSANVDEILQKMISPSTQSPSYELGETSKDESSALDNISHS
ncbi:uncharacterized protein LOC114166932 [Vigna unguiculata]|uniref:uncharacterized protein LOC114166932 n=1 Tax=Vigna unguiculata TaxID=3917 RepID=UPI001016B8CF|nr:uncharacterized protein LOC114166932 [Vigna unguiculata]